MIMQGEEVGTAEEQAQLTMFREYPCVHFA